MTALPDMGVDHRVGNRSVCLPTANSALVGHDQNPIGRRLLKYIPQHPAVSSLEVYSTSARWRHLGGTLIAYGQTSNKPKPLPPFSC